MNIIYSFNNRIFKLALHWKIFPALQTAVTRCLTTTASVSASARAAATGLKPCNEIPGPRQLPIIGNGWELAANMHRFWLYIDEGFDKYGKIYQLNTFGK